MDTSAIDEIIRFFTGIFVGANIPQAAQRAIVWGSLIATGYVAFLYIVAPAGSPFWVLRRSRALLAGADAASIEAAQLEGRVDGLRTQLELLIGHPVSRTAPAHAATPPPTASPSERLKIPCTT